jgi:CheY-like chemotaxis protein
MTRGRVLCIEDDPASLQLIERLLEQRPGIELVQALEGTQGLTLAVQCRPDLILLDLRLQDMAGEQVLRAIRAQPKLRLTPVIVITAEPYPRLPEWLRRAGADAYLRKPLDFNAFFSAIDAALHDRASSDL